MAERMAEFARVYIETSVILRWTLGEPGALTDVNWVSAFSSELLAVEVRRTFDRLRLTSAMPKRKLMQLRDGAERNLTRMTLFPLDQSVLKRAGEPFPTPIKTLDAIHLATALFLNDAFGGIVLLTHDRQLGVAAKDCGLAVYPVPNAP
jgi:predicted nucleic acid-binding protein